MITVAPMAAMLDSINVGCCEERVWRQSQRHQGLQLSRMTCTWLPHISHKHLESCAGVPGYRRIHFDGDMPLLPWLAEAACLVRWCGLLCVDGNWEYLRVRGPGFGGDINKGDINKKKQDWIHVCRRILLQRRSSWPVGRAQEDVSIIPKFSWISLTYSGLSHLVVVWMRNVSVIQYLVAIADVGTIFSLCWSPKTLGELSVLYILPCEQQILWAADPVSSRSCELRVSVCWQRQRRHPGLGFIKAASRCGLDSTKEEVTHLWSHLHSAFWNVTSFLRNWIYGVCLLRLHIASGFFICRWIS
jgi:hypothetical protein